VTANPNAAWVTQQARDPLLVWEEQGRRVRFLLRDCDAKFCYSTDDVFRSQGADIVLTPVQAPNANAYAERWIRTVRAECLDWLLVIGQGHLDRILRVYVGALQPAPSAPSAVAGAARPSLSQDHRRGSPSPGAPA
jgi:hypothetical protein